MNDPNLKRDEYVAPTPRERRARSLFWPLMLIVVGVVVLLANFGIFPSANIVALLRLWPLALIVIGLEIVLGHSQRRLANLIAVCAVAFAVVFALFAPTLGLVNTQVTSKEFTEPLTPATKATVEIAPSVGNVTVSAGDAANLIDANLTYEGQVNFAVTGTTEKTVSLRQDSSFNNSFNFFDFIDSNKLAWDIRLNPTIPLALTMDAGAGNSTLDLSQLKLQRFAINAGVGNINLTLPAGDTAYDSDVKGGVGNVQVNIAQNTSLHLTLKAGVGNITVNVPSGAAVHLSTSGGLGNVNLDSSRFMQIDGSNKNGTYETKDFSSASQQITISYDGGVGNFTLQ